MKKTLLTSLFCGVLFLNSCQTEGEVVKTFESSKTEEMVNFDKAFKSLGEPQNRPTEEEKRSGSAELSDRRKKVLLPSSIALIKSTGITDAQLQARTNGDMTATIVWAIQINQEKTNQLKNDLKSEK